MLMNIKVLIIRFSSFGDVTQALSIPVRLKALGPEVDVHWVTRLDLAPLLENHPHIKKIWTLDRKTGLKGLFSLLWQLRREKFTHVYDAHNNLRSHILSWGLFPSHLLRKSQKRWKRFLLFRLRKNTYQMPFSGQRDLLEPLAKWHLPIHLPPPPQIVVQENAYKKISSLLSTAGMTGFVTLAPSAAFPLKRWPLSHWISLIRLNPEVKFICLGGKEDRFLHSLSEHFPQQVLVWAGELSLQESVATIALSRALVSNDTGLLHVAEQLGKPAIALMGPAPFGFPSRDSTRILELSLSCRPCSKHGQGPCVNKVYQKCLADISPEQVSQELWGILR